MEVPADNLAKNVKDKAETGAAWPLWLLFIGILLYVPSFSLGELEDEEGRRAIPAREMIAAGSYVLPTVWQQPYLNKPPLYPWTVALASTVTGGVNEAATRLPSVIATILTALGLYAFARWRGRPRAGGLAGLLFLVSFATFEKGAFGELEALLALLVFASLALLWASIQDRSLGVSIAAGLCLGGAFLIKGPAVLVFLGAGLCGFVWAARRWSVLFSPRLWVPVVLGFMIAGSWVALLLVDVSSEVVFARWWQQAAGTSSVTIADHAADRGRFFTGVLLGFMPSSLLCLFAWRSRSRWLDDPLARVALGVLAGSLVLFFLYPGTKPRYVYPALPWCCLAGGVLLDAALAGHAELVLVRARRAAVVFLALGALGMVAGIVSGFRPIAGVQLSGVGSILLLVVTALALWLGVRGAVARRTGAAFLIPVLVVFACFRLLQLTQVVPQTAGRHGRVVLAAEVDRVIPEDEERVLLHVPGEYNVMFYIDRSLCWIEDPGEAESGEVLLVDAGVLADHPELVSGWDVLGRMSLEKQQVLVARVR
jgi:4-amino-4-deoxy-L-arabinose transferase-like glycosyltransferase